MVSMNLEEVCLLRSNELTRILAGCVAINPLKVLPLIDKLRPESLTDDVARQFILVMRGRFPELQIADNDHQGILFIEWATEHHLLFEYALWMTEIKDSIEDAKNAIRELQALAITLHEIEGLQAWIKAQEAYVNGR
jgi:hypothetical protein